MDTLIGILSLVIGFVIGAAACAVFYREKLRNATDIVRAQLEPEKATLVERLSQTESQLLAEKNQAAAKTAELAKLRESLTEESKLRAAAEEKALRIVALESTL